LRKEGSLTTRYLSLTWTEKKRTLGIEREVEHVYEEIPPAIRKQFTELLAVKAGAGTVDLEAAKRQQQAIEQQERVARAGVLFGRNA
jgi:hypothetical protein